MIASFLGDLFTKILANLICIGVCVVVWVVIRNLGRKNKK
jgi:hypothetical protein